jgi:PAS domain S-box-containing protein
VLCTYSLAACGAYEILDAVRTHQFALARREGKWVVIETAALKQAKAEINRLNEELEQRVVQRTSELTKTEQKYRVMIETASDAVVCMDESGAIVLANPATMRVFGYEPTEVIGKPLTVLMPEFLRKVHEDGYRRYLATGQRHLNWQGHELTGLRKNGQEFPVEVTFGEVTADGHRIFTGFVRDISERKQAEELRASLHQTQGELARISRLTTMGELTASIAHEVNQPLTAITNNGSACLRLLVNKNLDPEVLRRALEEIVADGNRASAVIARIRGFIKKAPAEKSELDVNEVIQEVLALVGPELQKNRVALRCELGKTLPLVLADRVQLQQVLLNLIVNGIEAMTAVTERPRELVVQSQIEESGDLMVTVRDSGTGLSSETDRVFTPFFTTKANGMGMGLPISRSLVESHGGRLWATSNSPHGAVFSFTLPAAGSSS